MKVIKYSSYFTSIIAISIVFVGGMLGSPVFADHTMKHYVEECGNYCSAYSPVNAQSGDTFEIFGKVPSWKTEPIIFRIISPIGNIVSVDQVTPNYNGYYTGLFQLDGEMFKKSGTYQVRVSGSDTYTISFEFEKTKKILVSEKTTEIIQPYNFEEPTINQIQRDNPNNSGNEFGFLGIIIIPIIIGILIIIIRNNKKPQTSTVVPSQEESITNIDKQIAINEEKIRRVKEESKRIDGED